MSLIKIKQSKNLNSKITKRNIIFLILQKKNFMKKFIKDKVNSVSKYFNSQNYNIGKIAE